MQKTPCSLSTAGLFVYTKKPRRNVVVNVFLQGRSLKRSWLQNRDVLLYLTNLSSSLIIYCSTRCIVLYGINTIVPARCTFIHFAGTNDLSVGGF